MTWAKDLVRFGSPLFVMPLAILAYSEIELSFYFIIHTIIGFAMLADSGFGSVLVRAVSYFDAGADYLPRTKEEFHEAEKFDGLPPNKQKLADLFTTTRRIYAVLSGFLILMLTTGGTAFIWNLMEQAEHRFDLWLAFGLLIPFCVISINNVRWSSFMRGLNFVAVEARVSTIINATRILLFIVLLAFKLEPMYIVIGFLLSASANHLYLRWFINKWIRENDIQLRHSAYFDKGIFKSMWSATWRMAGILYGNFFVEQGNVILIAQITDVKLMANFLLTSRLLRIALLFSRSPLYAKIPFIYNLAAKKKFDEIKKHASQYIFLGMSMTVTAFLILGMFGNPILELTPKEVRLLPVGLFIIMALTEILDMHSGFHGSIYTSTNHVPFLLPSLLAGAAIFLVGKYWTLPAYGVHGIIFTRFFLQLAFNNWYAPALNLNLLKWPLHRYLFDVPSLGTKFLFQKGMSFIKKS